MAWKTQALDDGHGTYTVWAQRRQPSGRILSLVQRNVPPERVGEVMGQLVEEAKQPELPDTQSGT